MNQNNTTENNSSETALCNIDGVVGSDFKKRKQRPVVKITNDGGHQIGLDVHPIILIIGVISWVIFIGYAISLH